MMKKFLTVIIPIIIAIVFICVFLIGFINETVFVTGYNETTFNYSVDHLRIGAIGSKYEFKCFVDKEELFDGFMDSYKVFKKTNDSISVIYNNQIFTLRNLSDKKYILYGEYIIWVKDNEVYYIPFPTEYISKNSHGVYRIETEGKKTVDFKTLNIPYEDLENFYSVYPEISLTEDVVEGPNFILKLNGDKGTVLLSPKVPNF